MDTLDSGGAAEVPVTAIAATGRLSVAQRGAIEQLVAGATPVAAAAAVGVSRTTVYRWLKSDPDFTAAYHAWQADAVAASRDRLLALADAAVDTVAAAVAKGDVRTALTVLKSQGLLTPPTPGPTDPALIARRARHAAAEARAAMTFDECAVPGEEFPPLPDGDDLHARALAEQVPLPPRIP